MPLIICTVGHSTRSLDELVAILHHARVERILDVRSIRRSRRHPQYDQHGLAAGLADHGIGYDALPELGGRRPRACEVAPDLNGFWQNRSFHNYADYALSNAFQAGLDRLLELSRDQRCAIMCAEALWWRCHRRIIADYLIQRGAEVHHLMGARRVELGRPTAAAKAAAEGRLIYPAP
jgi:uncharacterized protein (DUF488 family)